MPEGGRVRDGFSLGALRHFRAHANAADYVAYLLDYGRVGSTPVAREGAYSAGILVSDNFLSVLGIELQQGPGFRAGVPGDDAQIVLSDKTWRLVFDSDPGIVGRSIWFSGVPATVVGVTRPEFVGLAERNIDFLIEMSGAVRLDRRSAREVVSDDTSCCVSMVGRRRDGWTQVQVRQELAALTSQYREALGRPPLRVDTRGTAPLLAPGTGVEVVFALIGAGVVLVWCLTCANVGNLFLARSLRRNREIAVRLALGASRSRLVRQLLAEGLVLALCAGAAALACALVVPALVARVDGTAQMYEPDWRVALVAGAATVATCILVALTPALQATRVAVFQVANATTPRAGRFREVVLAIQIAVAAVLILSATLIGRGVLQASSAHADFALHTTSLVSFELPAGSLDAPESRRTITTQVRDAVERSDGTLGLIDAIASVPTRGAQTSVQIPDSRAEFRARLLSMTPAAFSILDVPIVAGRMLSDDVSLPEALVNETLARQVWPGESPLGKPINIGFFHDQTFTVIGVTGDTHLTSLSTIEPVIHTTPRDTAIGVMVARTAPDLGPRMSSLARAIDPSFDAVVRPLAESARASLENALLGASVAGGLSVVALVLAVIGIYGVFSYLVEERRREIGIRLALGATKPQVRRALAAACRRPVVGGLAGGLVLSLLAGAVLRGMLLGLSPLDPVSYGVVALVLAAAALVATAGPVRRALRVDPAVTLRAD